MLNDRNAAPGQYRAVTVFDPLNPSITVVSRTHGVEITTVSSTLTGCGTVLPGGSVTLTLTDLTKASQCVIAHCWHRIAPLYLSNPPKQPQRCCWCGERRVETLYGGCNTVQHGPHAPKT